MKQKLKFFCVSSLIFSGNLFGQPSEVGAHVKWFVEKEASPLGSVQFFSITEPWVQVWLGIILGAVVVALVLDRYIFNPPAKLVAFAETHRPRILHIFQVLVGLALLVAAVQGAIMAPHLESGDSFGLILRFVEGFIGVLFIANIAIRLGAALMVLLFLASTLRFGFVTSLEYFNILGIALFLLADLAKNQTVRTYALPLLRIHSGIALGVLAWTEKLGNPGLAMQFLEKNQINFMRFLDEHIFTDRFFVLCAGCTELIFALIFILGLITRINTLALAGFLVASNLYFVLIGKTDEAFLELTGHLPLIAIAIILILYGSGDRLKITNLFSRPSREELAGGGKGSGQAPRG